MLSYKFLSCIPAIQAFFKEVICLVYLDIFFNISLTLDISWL